MNKSKLFLTTHEVKCHISVTKMLLLNLKKFIKLGIEETELFNE